MKGLKATARLATHATALLVAAPSLAETSAERSLRHHCEEHPEDEHYCKRPDGPEKQGWYGAPIIVVDAAGVGALILASALAANSQGDSDGAQFLAVASAGTYLFGGPLVHWKEQRVASGFISLGLRASLPVLGAFVGYLIDDESDGFGIPEATVAGAVIGFPMAMIIDAGVVAHYSGASNADENSNSRSSTALRLLPSVDPRHGSAGLRLLGVW